MSFGNPARFEAGARALSALSLCACSAVFLREPAGPTAVECSDQLEAPVTDIVLGVASLAVYAGASISITCHSDACGPPVFLVASPLILVGGLYGASAAWGFHARGKCRDVKRAASRSTAPDPRAPDSRTAPAVPSPDE